MKSLVVFSRDPGATQQLIAMLQVLAGGPSPHEAPGLAAFRAEATGFAGDIRVVARPPGFGIWQAAGWQPDAWDGRTDADAALLLREANAGALLTGTSDVDEPGDRALWRAARAASITSHTVLDQRVNLAARFVDADGRVVHPDRVYVPDSDYAVLLAQAGIPQERIRISGHIHFARLSRLYGALSPQQIAAQRDSWRIREGRRVILFASECGREMSRAGRPMPYDELVVLERLVADLEQSGHPAAAGRPAASISVVVRPHPRDSAGKYQAYEGCRRSGLEVVVSGAGDPVTAMAAADMVVGMNSSVLHEAKAVGHPVMSLTGAALGDEEGATP